MAQGVPFLGHALREVGGKLCGPLVGCHYRKSPETPISKQSLVLRHRYIRLLSRGCRFDSCWGYSFSISRNHINATSSAFRYKPEAQANEEAQTFACASGLYQDG